MNTIFTLEVMQALHGDCLLLHFGPKDNPKVMLIDGGPSKVYMNYLKPRLIKIKSALSPNEKLNLSMIMVSHLDDDHVKGIIELSQEMNGGENFKTDNFWVNTFDNIIGNLQFPVVSSIAASVSASNAINTNPLFKNTEGHFTAVIASVSQGRELVKNIKAIDASINNPINGLITSQSDKEPIVWDHDLKITIIHPNLERLTKLQKVWDKALQEAKDKGDPTISVASLVSPDTSAFNLSSIVCLLEIDKKTILLTGDSRSDDILEGLELNDLLKDTGKLHVDILKIPHHGSIRNATKEFYQKVIAKHYIFSANGKHDNPDLKMLELFAEATQGNDDFTLHFTNREGDNNLEDKLQGFIDSMHAKGRKFKFSFRNPSENSIMLNLLEEVKY